MHRVESGKSMYLVLGLLYFTAQLTGISNAGDICSNDELKATSELKTIFSPNFPSNYSNNVRCDTHITSPENTVIELTFDSFELEYSGYCIKDSLSIISGEFDTLLYPECGGIDWPNFPEKIVSRSNDMTITFVTDDQISYQGFNATFRAVQPSQHYLFMTENSTVSYQHRFNGLGFYVRPDGLMDPLAVDYDPRTQYVYYSDRGAKIIGRIHFDFFSLQTVLHSEHILEPFGLRIDVNSRLLYWTDAGQGTISVSNLDGKYRNTIIDSELDKPGAIVTEPYKGYMYFSDWGTDPKIERADGDGQNRLVLVNSHLVSPRALAIDLKERRLYWIDSTLKSLESVNYDGTGRKILKVLSPVNVFSLVLDDDAFFYTGFDSDDPSESFIYYVDRKLNSDNIRIRWLSENNYKGLSLRPSYESGGGILDTCPTADCKWLCLPKPNGQHTCLKANSTKDEDEQSNSHDHSLAVGLGISFGLLALVAVSVAVYKRCRKYRLGNNHQNEGYSTANDLM